MWLFLEEVNVVCWCCEEGIILFFIILIGFFKVDFWRVKSRGNFLLEIIRKFSVYLGFVFFLGKIRGYSIKKFVVDFEEIVGFELCLEVYLVILILFLVVLDFFHFIRDFVLVF